MQYITAIGVKKKKVPAKAFRVMMPYARLGSRVLLIPSFFQDDEKMKFSQSITAIDELPRVVYHNTQKAETHVRYRVVRRGRRSV